MIHLPANLDGRDFIVGDLHGCYNELMKLLKFVHFNIETDRVFCVGDLIHRGPYSIDCLNLLKKKNKQGNKWFYSTVGNHDDISHQRQFASEKVSIQNHKEEIAKLPLIYRIDHPIFKQFYIVHSEINYDGLININHRTDSNISEKEKAELNYQLTQHEHADKIINMLNSSGYVLSESQRRRIFWSRDIFEYFNTKNKIQTHMGEFDFIFNERNTNIANKIKIFCGHSVVPFPMVIGHQIYCDTGACFGYNAKNKIKLMSQWGSLFFSLSMIEVNTGKIFSCVTSQVEENISEAKRMGEKMKKWLDLVEQYQLDKQPIKRGDIVELSYQLYDSINDQHIIK